MDGTPATQEQPALRGEHPAAWGFSTRDAVLAGTLVLLCLAVYGRQLTTWFTAPDTFPLIESSRVSSWGDLLAVLTEPLMAGTGFTKLGLFYRPLTSLTFSLDYAIWGLDPFGYHLTNLLLHTASVVLVFLLARRLVPTRRGVAWTTGAFYALHPVMIEGFPGIERRQDALAAVLVLSALLAYLQHRREGRTRWLIASVAAGVLAFAAKEIALLLPAFILVHATLFPIASPSDRRARLRHGLVTALPFLAAAAAWMAWRTVVLGGLGGYHGHPSIGQVAWFQGLPAVQTRFMAALLPLANLVKDAIRPSLGEAWLLNGLVALTVAGLVLWAYRGQLNTLASDARAWLASYDGRLVTMLVAWVALGNLLFLASLTFSDRSAALLIAPFALALVLVLTRALDAASRLWDRSGPPRELTAGQARRARMGAATSAVLGVVLISSLWISPAVHGSEHWREEGELQKAYLTRLGAVVGDNAPDGARLELHDVPRGIRSHNQDPYRVRTIVYPQVWTVQAYLTLQHGEDRVSEVDIETRMVLEAPTDRVHLDWGSPEEGRFIVDADYPV